MIRVDEIDSVDLLARWKAGDEQAAAAIFDRYVNQLMGDGEEPVIGAHASAS